MAPEPTADPMATSRCMSGRDSGMSRMTAAPRSGTNTSAGRIGNPGVLDSIASASWGTTERIMAPSRDAQHSGQDEGHDDDGAGRDAERVAADVTGLHPPEDVTAPREHGRDAVDGAVDDRAIEPAEEVEDPLA